MDQAKLDALQDHQKIITGKVKELLNLERGSFARLLRNTGKQAQIEPGLILTDYQRRNYLGKPFHCDFIANYGKNRFSAHVNLMTLHHSKVEARLAETITHS